MAMVRYDRNAGKFYWRQRPSNRVKVGQEVGSPHSKGYIEASILGRRVLLHHLVWYFEHGELPPEGMLLDHKDTDKTNNHHSNLRLATIAQNNCNVPAKRNSKSGVKGVFWSNRDSKWVAKIQKNGKQRTLGYFTDLASAKSAYDAAALDLHGEYHHA